MQSQLNNQFKSHEFKLYDMFCNTCYVIRYMTVYNKSSSVIQHMLYNRCYVTSLVMLQYSFIYLVAKQYLNSTSQPSR